MQTRSKSRRSRARRDMSQQTSKSSSRDKENAVKPARKERPSGPLVDISNLESTIMKIQAPTKQTVAPRLILDQVKENCSEEKENVLEVDPAKVRQKREAKTQTTVKPARQHRSSKESSQQPTLVQPVAQSNPKLHDNSHMLLLNYFSVILSLFSFCNVLYTLQTTKARSKTRPETCLQKAEFADQLNCYLTLLKSSENSSQSRELAILFVCSVTMALAVLLVCLLQNRN